MIPLCVPNLAGREGEYLAECVSSTFVSSVGPFVTRFEEMVAAATGCPGAVATSAGTTALHAALLVVGVRPNDLVICPSMTFIASANAISHCGATPWLFDIDPLTWTLDCDALERVLPAATHRRGEDLIHSETGRRVSAILPVYTLGSPADMDRISALAKRYGLAVVADAAAALGVTYKGRPCGALGADITMISFNGNKTVTAGGGGAMVSQDEGLLRRARHLTTTARVTADYDHDQVGYNYRMTNLQAAVGVAQMEMLDVFIAAKRRIAARYRDAFAPVQDLAPFPDSPFGEAVHWFSGFVFADENGASRNVALRTHLREKGIDARPFWKPMHYQRPYETAPRTDMAVSDDLWARVVTLPCSTHLSEADQEYVIDTVLAHVRQ